MTFLNVAKVCFHQKPFLCFCTHIAKLHKRNLKTNIALLSLVASFHLSVSFQLHLPCMDQNCRSYLRRSYRYSPCPNHHYKQCGCLPHGISTYPHRQPHSSWRLCRTCIFLCVSFCLCVFDFYPWFYMLTLSVHTT